MGAGRQGRLQHAGGVVSRWPSSLRFIYETEHHNGIAELLEILGRSVGSGMPREMGRALNSHVSPWS